MSDTDGTAPKVARVGILLEFEDGTTSVFYSDSGGATWEIMRDPQEVQRDWHGPVVKIIPTGIPKWTASVADITSGTLVTGENATFAVGHLYEIARAVRRADPDDGPGALLPATGD